MNETTKIITTFAQSPSGHPCITMTIGSEKWILLGVRRAPMAWAMVQQIDELFHAPAHIGLPLKRQESLEAGELIWHTEDGATGIYVREDFYAAVFAQIGDQM